MRRTTAPSAPPSGYATESMAVPVACRVYKLCTAVVVVRTLAIRFKIYTTEFIPMLLTRGGSRKLYWRRGFHNNQLQFFLTFKKSTIF